MNPVHGLRNCTVEQIATVLARFPDVEKAVLFGSRAKGVQKPGSDIDLALYGETLNWRVLAKIEDALDDLLLPYCFSLIIHNQKTDPTVALHILRVGQIFYRQTATPEAVS